MAEPGTDLGRVGRVDVIWRLFPGEVDGEVRDLLPTALECHPEVRWVHTASAGIDHLADLFSHRPTTILTHSAGVTSIPIAEFVVGCLLHHCKRAAELEENQRQRRYQALALRELADLQVVLFGLGAIATEVSKRLLPFGCRMTAVRRDPSRPSPKGVSAVYPFSGLIQACRGADALVLVAPLTNETAGAIGKEALAELAPESVLVNVARGGLIDESALLSGLSRGRPRAAYLDAFVDEPLPVNSPLWTALGVHLTPHLSWSSPHLARRTSQLFAEQLRRWVTGEPLLNRADPSAGY
ncbi:MAG TPA: D-2-hydroxyacid dehydrogenase [Candidatus Dormibacteraeota bacterium]